MLELDCFLHLCRKFDLVGLFADFWLIAQSLIQSFNSFIYGNEWLIDFIIELLHSIQRNQQANLINQTKRLCIRIEFQLISFQFLEFNSLHSCSIRFAEGSIVVRFLISLSGIERNSLIILARFAGIAQFIN